MARRLLFEREDGDADGVVLLRELRYAAESKAVTVISDRGACELDVRKVEPGELKEMLRELRKRNHDCSIKLVGI